MPTDDQLPGQVPLSEWRLGNFKSVEDQSIALGPLTLLVGENSVGKSSLLQSILLQTQAAQGDVVGDAFPLNGPLARVGRFEDVRFEKAKGKPIRLGGTFTVTQEFKRISRRQLPPRLRRSASASGTELFIESKSTTLVRWEVRLKSQPTDELGYSGIDGVEVWISNPEDQKTLRGDELHLKAKRSKQDLSRFQAGFERGQWLWSGSSDFRTGYVGKMTGANQRETVGGIALHAGLPYNVLVPRTEADALISQVGSAAFTFLAGRRLGSEKGKRRGDEEPQPQPDDVGPRMLAQELMALKEGGPATAQFMETGPTRFPLRQALRQLTKVHEGWLSRGPSALEALRQQLGDTEEILIPPSPQGSNVLTDAMDEVLTFFKTRVNYLGPLRQEPTPIYPLTLLPGGSIRAKSIGTKGEFAAAVLHTFSGHPVECPLPRGGTQKMPLENAVKLWFGKDGLQVFANLASVAMANLGLRLLVLPTEGGNWRDLSEVGVGTSQILPVVLVCLLADPGSLVLLEQPELHLHPALQQRLGDFLLACARSGRQLIVETHSEHIINRLRRRIAESSKDDIRPWVRLIYVEQSDGRSTYTQVVPNEYGMLDPDWPKGFFDQTADESKKIMESAIAKRTRRGRQPAGEG